MNCERWLPEQVYVYRQPVDMRKQIHGLATVVSALIIICTYCIAQQNAIHIVPMDGLPTNFPNDPKQLIALLQKQQRQLNANERELTRSEKRNARLEKKLHVKDNTIEKLEERLRALLIHRFGQHYSTLILRGSTRTSTLRL